MPIKTVGSMEKRVAASSVTTSAARSAGFLVTKWGAITEMRTQPGAASMMVIVRSRIPLPKRIISPTHGPAGGAPSYGGDAVLRQYSEEGQAG